MPYKLNPVWPSCQEPKFCSVAGITTPALIPANLTANTFNYTEQSWLLRDETITHVREYDFLEFSCNNTLHVSGNTSTFKIEVSPYYLSVCLTDLNPQCPTSGQFPTVYEYPVKDADGNYSARFVAPVLDDTRKIINENLTYWPLCRKAIKCYDDVPKAPYYSNLVTESFAPIKVKLICLK